MDHAANNTPTHLAWSIVYAKKLSRRFPQGDNISQTISFASQSNSTKSLYIGIEHIKSLPMAIGILKTKCEVHPPSNRRAVMSK